LEEARDAYLKRAGLLQEMIGKDGGNSDLRRMLGWSLIGQADILEREGKHAESIAMNQRAVDVFSALIESDPKDAQSRCDIGFAQIGIAASYWQLAWNQPPGRELHEARRWAEESVRALRFGQDQGLISPQDRGKLDEAVRLLGKIDGFR
jgi:hypothetical protein